MMTYFGDFEPSTKPFEQLASALNPVCEVFDAEELMEEIAEQLRLLVFRRNGLLGHETGDWSEDAGAAK